MAAIAGAARCFAPGAAISRAVGLALACAMLVASTPAIAQPKDVAGLATYAGADRTQRLSEGAKREGELTLYSSMQVDSITPLQKAFEAKYGVKIRIWRGAGKDILQRVVNEAAANRHDVDIVEGGQLRTGGALSRGSAAGGPVALSRRPHSGGAAPARPMGGNQAQYRGRRLQYSTCTQGEP